MKRYIYMVIFYSSLLFSLFSGFWALHQSTRTVTSLENLNSATSVSGIDKIYILNNDNILIHNYISGIFQCFDQDGNFIWGVHLPTTKNVGSTAISYDESYLYLWEGKTKTIYIYKDYKLVRTESNIDIKDKSKFYENYPMQRIIYECKFIWNGELKVTNMNNVDRFIKLKTPFNYYNFLYAIIGSILSAGIFTYIKKKYLQ